MEREKFASRLGFLLISAGCAIGLGNVWRFPFITGVYGGGAFVVFYLFFLFVFAMPIMVMELAVGRGSQKSVAVSFKTLEPKGTKWHWFGYLAALGNYMLMSFYTVIAGWIFAYLYKMITGEFVGKTPDEVGGIFGGLVSDPGTMLVWMLIVVCVGMFICSLGLQNGVEKVTKVLMAFLFVAMVALIFRAVTLPGAVEGLKFYLIPDFAKMAEEGFGQAVYAALGQAFFTLSLGIGSMAIFGSYLGKDRALTGEAIGITVLDTLVAIMAGLIIFPACFAFNVSPGSGPGLLFVTLPNVFNSMPVGRLWGSLFFVFMSFAAISTVIAVFENILSFSMDLWGFSRKKAVLMNIIIIPIISIPCALGFNMWSGFNPLGPDTIILDLLDFIVSDNLLPLGSLVYLVFCVSRYGWGWDKFIAEADSGTGMKFPKAVRFYMTYILPAIVLLIFIMGYYSKFFK